MNVFPEPGFVLDTGVKHLKYLASHHLQILGALQPKCVISFHHELEKYKHGANRTNQQTKKAKYNYKSQANCSPKWS